MVLWGSLAAVGAVAAALVAVLLFRQGRSSEPEQPPAADSVTRPRADVYWRSLEEPEELAEPGIDFEDLMSAPVQPERRPIDPRRLAALGQGERIGHEEEAWRRTSRATVLRTTDGGEVLYVPEVVSRPTAEEDLTLLVARGEQVRGRLGTTGERVDLAWPQEALLAYDGGLAGYFQPRLDGAFVMDVPRRGRAVRTLGVANGLRGAGLARLGDAELLDLVRTVAVWAAALHGAGVVFGDLGQRSLAYALDPIRVRVLDYETARVTGRRALLSPETGAPLDPLATDAGSSYDSDRFRFALLAFRLLVAGNDAAALEPTAVPPRLLGLDEHRTSRLRGLWSRAAGPSGRRPALEEWVAALPVPSPHA